MAEATLATSKKRSWRQKAERPADFLVFVTGIFAAVAAAPQIFTIWQNQSADGVSLTTFLLFYSAQLALAFMGVVKKLWAQAIMVGLTALMTTVLIVEILYFRF